MCRNADDPGGPRRCSRHMRENLHSAEVSAQAATDDLRERAMVLDSRQARLQSLTTDLDALPEGSTKQHPLRVEQRRVERLVTKGLAERNTALDRQRKSQEAWHEAQADYDSTRDGMHDLREALDTHPADTATLQRYITARDRYAQEAQRRTVTYGPQVPLSKRGLGKERGLAGRLARAEVRFWLKSSVGPDHELGGLYGHRVNLTRVDSAGRRRSVTLPYPAAEPVRPDGYNVHLDGEPTASEVCSYLSTQIIRDDETFREWAVRMSRRGSPNSRGDWHTARQISTALSNFVH